MQKLILSHKPLKDTEIPKGYVNVHGHIHNNPLHKINPETNFEKDFLTDYFQKIKEKCEFKKWYFGHYHDYRQVYSQFILLYEDIVPLEFTSIFE